MTRHGSCLCGNIEFDLTNDTKDGIACYCLNCRKTTSSGSLNLKTSPDEVTVTKGTPKVYNDASTRSGKPMARSFCGDCGTPLWSDPSAAPGVRYLKVGTLDDAEGVDLKMELFVDKAIPCTVHPKGSQTQLDSKMQPV